MSCIYAIPIHHRLYATSVRPLDDQTVYVPINPTIFGKIKKQNQAVIFSMHTLSRFVKVLL